MTEIGAGWGMYQKGNREVICVFGTICRRSDGRLFIIPEDPRLQMVEVGEAA